MAEGSGEVVAVPPSGAANGLSNGAGGTSAQSSNPLSRKLHKILETRLDNDKVIGAGGAEHGPGRSVPDPPPYPSSPPRRAPQARGTHCSAGAGRVRRGGRGALGKARRFSGCYPCFKRFLKNSGSRRQMVASPHPGGIQGSEQAERRGEVSTGQMQGARNRWKGANYQIRQRESGVRRTGEQGEA